MNALDDKISTLTGILAGIGTQVATMSPEVSKISGETSTLVQQLTDLKNNPPSGATPEQLAALDAAIASATSIQSSLGTVATSLQAVDDLVPDAAPPASPPAGAAS